MKRMVAATMLWWFVVASGDQVGPFADLATCQRVAGFFVEWYGQPVTSECWNDGRR